MPAHFATTTITIKLETPGSITALASAPILERPALGVASVAGIGRISGLVQIRHLLELITDLDLEANPRDSKVGPVTKAIHATLNNSPELLPFKSKGILLAASGVEQRADHRFELTFDDLAVEGILDGGHNTLAVALYLLGQTSIPEKEYKRVKSWGDLKAVWPDYLEELIAIAEDGRTNTALLPVEILCPADATDPKSTGYFAENLLQICTARNNNVQLKQETTANQKGLLDPLKEALPEDIAEEVEWRTNEGGRIKVGDLVSLLWVALGKLDLPANAKGDQIAAIKGQQAYSSKATAFERYVTVMQSPEVSENVDGDYRLLMTNTAIQSALDMLPTLMRISDRIEEEFPAAYNKAGGSYGRIQAVQKASKGAGLRSRYFNKQLKQAVPAGFLYPVLFSVGALIDVVETEDGQKLEWMVDNPEQFVADHLVQIMEQIRAVMESMNWDPQPVGKKELSYKMAYGEMDNIVLRANR